MVKRDIVDGPTVARRFLELRTWITITFIFVSTDLFWLSYAFCCDKSEQIPALVALGVILFDTALHGHYAWGRYKILGRSTFVYVLYMCQTQKFGEVIFHYKQYRKYWMKKDLIEQQNQENKIHTAWVAAYRQADLLEEEVTVDMILGKGYTS